MPQQQPTMYDIMGRPLINKGINYARNQGIRYAWDQWGKPLYDQYGRPLWDKVMNWGAPEAAEAGTEASNQLGSMGYEASPYYTGAATTAASEGSGLGGLSAGGYAQVAAPLVMAYLKYQAGSGRNEPVEKMIDTKKTGRLLADMINDKKIDWTDTENQYGIKPKELSREISGVDPENYSQMVDPRGWSAKDLYDRMLEESSQYYQTGGVGNSGYSGNQINEMFGPNQDKLAKAMGLPSLPNWNYHDKGSGFSQNYLNNDPTGKALQAQVGYNPFDEQWNALDDQTKYNYSMLQSPDMEAEGFGKRMWQNDQIVKELNDKYKLGLQTYSERMARLNQGL
jgi:hypothetical protein